MAKKGNRVQVILECTEHKDSGHARHVPLRDHQEPQEHPDRIELKKYNPILRKMTVHKEIK